MTTTMQERSSCKTMHHPAHFRPVCLKPTSCPLCSAHDANLNSSRVFISFDRHHHVLCHVAAYTWNDLPKSPSQTTSLTSFKSLLRRAGGRIGKKGERGKLTEALRHFQAQQGDNFCPKLFLLINADLGYWNISYICVKFAIWFQSNQQTKPILPKKKILKKLKFYFNF